MIQIARPVTDYSCPPQAVAPSRTASHQKGESVLRASTYPALRRLNCHYHSGVLTIRGRVSTYYLKQMAQTVLRKLDGVEMIDNQVEVQHADLKKF